MPPIEDLPDRPAHHVGRVGAHALERSAVRAAQDRAARVHRAAGDRRAAAVRAACCGSGRPDAGGAARGAAGDAPVAAVLLRHVPLVLFLAGMPFFAIALADPLTGFTREEVSYPGRRIALLVDGSTSMVIRFESTAKRQGEATFFTAVAAPSSSSAAA